MIGFTGRRYAAASSRRIPDGEEFPPVWLGLRPPGYRAPGFDFSPRTVSLLQEYGFSYDSSFMRDDFSAYYVREGDQASSSGPYQFGRPVDLVGLPASWALTDVPCFEFVWGALPGLRSPSAVDETWRGDFDFAVDRSPGGIYVLTLHRATARPPSWPCSGSPSSPGPLSPPPRSSPWPPGPAHPRNRPA